jgi:two-component system, NtrC family, sensor kinase
VTNNVADDAQRVIADLRRSLDEQVAQQTATAAVLKVIGRSTFDLQTVLETLIKSAVELSGANRGSIFLREGEVFPLKAASSTTPEFLQYWAANPAKAGRGSATSRVIASGKVEIIPDVLDEPDIQMPAGSLSRIRAALGVPMLRDDKVEGVMVLTRPEPGPFTQSQISLVETFADQAMIAIENARLFDEVQTKTANLQESLQQQTATADVLKVISRSAFNLQRVLETLVESAARLCEADNAFVYQRGPGGYRLAATHGFSKDYEDFMRKQPVQPGRGTLIGRTTQEARIVHIPDVLADREYSWPESQQRGGYRTMLGVPLLREGDPIGVFAMTRSSVKPFTTKQIALLQTFSDQAVIAIENTRLFNETNEALERQTATADILKVIASSPSNVQPVFEAIAERSKRLVDALSTTVFRLEDGMMHLKAFTSTTPEADATLKAMFPAPLSDFSWGGAINSGEIHRVIDTELEIEGLRELARLRGFRSMLFVPLLRDRKPIGVIAVTREEPGPFIDHHVQLLQTFADQAVIAIENVRLFDEVQERTEDLKESLQQQTATADVLKVISRSAFDLKSVLTTLTESAKSLCGASLGIICLRDGEVMRLQAESGCTKAFVDFMQTHPIRPGRETITGRVFLDGKAVHVADVQLDPEYRFGDASAVGAYRAVLAVPLMRGGAVEGVLLLGRPAPGPFSQRQMDLVQTFADQAVIAIENVRLFEQVQARTRELSLSLDELRTAQDRLVQTEKLASLGQLTAGIAHEIKNPLNFVNNFSALSGELIDELNELLESAALDGKVREEIDELANMLKGNLEKVVQHGKRADSIVKNMLLHSREGSGERRSADINTIVEESLNLAYHGARAERSGFNITLRRDLDPSAGIIDLYPQEITRVFLNLISNGFYAANKRREAGDEGFEPLLTATTKNLGSRVEIRIRDNGTGIPAEVREKMFNPFFTTKPAGEGTGLGLSMSHDIIVKQHGGRIDVETEPGAFTEFIITLPRAAAQT